MRSAEQRTLFLEPLIEDIGRPKNILADGMRNQKVVTLLKYKLDPILTELKRKFKRNGRCISSFFTHTY
jgi:hypothetical protein